MNKKMLLMTTCLLFIGLAIATFTLTGAQDKRVLLKGDLHCHTVYSHDGKYTLEETAKYAKKAGFDFIAVTDHNTTRQNNDPYNDDKLIIIPGMELTLTRSIGHANIIGIKEPKENISMVTKKEVEQYFYDMRAAGAKIQINHPFHRTWPWSAGMDTSFNWVELWNGNWADYNQKAIEWWQEELAKGRRIVGTGGTDAHSVEENRSPVNCVYSSSKQPGEILSAIEKGNIYVSFSAKGPDVELKCGKSIMGDVIPYKAGKKINLKVLNLKAGNVIRIMSDKGCEHELSASDTSFVKEWAMEDRMFYRIEIWRDSSLNTLLAFSNPLYIKKTE